MLSNLCQLSKFNIEDDKLSDYSNWLDQFVDYIDKVKCVDTEGVLPLYNVNNSNNCLREDEVEQSMSNEQILLNSKDSYNGFITVYKTV